MIGGELDMATAPELALILGTISSTGSITLDVGLLRFVDEAGLSVLATTASRLSGSLVLVDPQPELIRLMEILGKGTPQNLVLRVPSEPVIVTRAKPGSATA